MKEYLPIGSVVTLKNGTKKVMICGRVQRETKQGSIYYVGMQDSEEFRFRAKMEEELNRLSAPA